MKINLGSESLKLRSDPNVSHADAAEMYHCYGSHISTESHGDIRLQVVAYEWMDGDKDAAQWRTEALAALSGPSEGDFSARAKEINQWADRCDDYAVLRLHSEVKLDWDECETLVALARRVRGDMESIEEALARAADAAIDGDLGGCLEALRDARNLETDHGDDPSTSGLAAQLIEEQSDAGEASE